MPIQTHDLERLPDSELECLRCQVHLKQAGQLSLAPSNSMLTLQPANTLLPFEVYLCPRCGKAEFFV